MLSLLCTLHTAIRIHCIHIYHHQIQCHVSLSQKGLHNATDNLIAISTKKSTKVIKYNSNRLVGVYEFVDKYTFVEVCVKSSTILSTTINLTIYDQCVFISTHVTIVSVHKKLNLIVTASSFLLSSRVYACYVSYQSTCVHVAPVLTCHNFHKGINHKTVTTFLMSQKLKTMNCMRVCTLR